MADFNGEEIPTGDGGGGAVVTYHMCGAAVVGGAPVHWSVTGSADFAGASAPEAVTDVVLMGTSEA